MFRSTLFTLAISALAAMVLAAPSNVKRHNDDESGVIGVNDVGIIANVDEALKEADLLNDVNLLSSEHHDHHHDHDHDFDHFGEHFDHYDDHDHYYAYGDDY